MRALRETISPVPADSSTTFDSTYTTTNEKYLSAPRTQQYYHLRTHSLRSATRLNSPRKTTETLLIMGLMEHAYGRLEARDACAKLWAQIKERRWGEESDEDDRQMADMVVKKFPWVQDPPNMYSRDDKGELGLGLGMPLEPTTKQRSWARKIRLGTTFTQQVRDIMLDINVRVAASPSFE